MAGGGRREVVGGAAGDDLREAGGLRQEGAVTEVSGGARREVSGGGAAGSLRQETDAADVAGGGRQQAGDEALPGARHGAAASGGSGQQGTEAPSGSCDSSPQGGGGTSEPGNAVVRIETVLADVAAQPLAEVVPQADLVWAASMVHHLPDQQAGIDGLASALKPGGVLAVAEGGLELQTLPWDLGVGAPGLERRLLAAREQWFGEMRAGMEGSVRMPYGWTTALSRAGLREIGSFSALVEHPAPTTETVRRFVVRHVARLVEALEERISDDDREAARRLLDSEGAGYLGDRDDLYVLGTRTVHTGRR
ncbi:class I SAM-dependent methyltransferase [Amycolatopsis bartoniae]|nr:class I SAM-dependent methyltransferase [Amycolatopsis bartoniae]